MGELALVGFRPPSSSISTDSRCLRLQEVALQNNSPEAGYGPRSVLRKGCFRRGRWWIVITEFVVGRTSINYYNPGNKLD